MIVEAVSIIGSFRRYYAQVLEALAIFEGSGIHVLSPARSRIINSTDEFVRFATDPPFSANADIQDRAFDNIFRSDAVYVVAPQGYIGRTTCLEIGRVLDRGMPLYFSEAPGDLPIRISADQIASPTQLVERWASEASLAADVPAAAVPTAAEWRASRTQMA